MPDVPAPDREQYSTEISDHSLLRRLRNGSEDAATELYLRYADRLFSLTRANTSTYLAPRVDAEDLVQSVFRTFFRRVSTGDYDVPEGEELWKLFLVMALNKIRSASDFHRAAKRNVCATAGGDALTRSAAASGGDETSLNLLRMVIDDVLGELTPPHREIIRMRIEGHDVASIAERQGRSKRAVERILQGFRESLSKLICEDE